MEFRYKDTAHVNDLDLKTTAGTLAPYLEHMKAVYDARDYNALEASLCLSHDEGVFKQVSEFLGTYKKPELRYVFLIGIGGSNLGTKAVYDALRGEYELFRADEYPKIIFVDTVSGSLLNEIELVIAHKVERPEEILVNIVSKSGITLETITNAEIVLAALGKKFGELRGRVVVTTTAGSKLEEWAQAKNCGVLHIPEKVGGRYSVFSPVGLFPLGLCGFNIEDMLHGADNENSVSLSADAETNKALQSAIAQFANLNNGKAIHDHFLFAPELESLGKWSRQIIAESLGKGHKVGDVVVHSGITPTVSIGSTDLHSIAQLTFGGPRDKYTTFVQAESGTDITVPSDANFDFLAADIAGKKVDGILSAIYSGVTRSYKNEELPFSEIILGRISEYSLGEFMQFKMIETMLLGKLMDVDAFDQPAVENYKEETRKILES